MYSLEVIQQMNEERAKEAQEEGKQPLLVRAKVDAEMLRHIPNIGDFRPKGWKLVDTLFVDSSGLGQEGEPAMTFTKFCDRVKPGYGYAIIEAGQFQVYIGEFRRGSKDEKTKD